MNRWIRTGLALAALLATAGSAEAQGWRISGGDRVYHGHGTVAPGTAVITSQPTQVYSTTAMPPPAYGRPAAPGGLIETAARRINPFANPSRAWDVAFAPTPYRQPGPARAARPVFGVPGYQAYPTALPTIGADAATSGPIPGINCPTCPK